MIGIDVSFLFGGVIVLVRQGFPFQKFFLAGKVLAGQADDDFIGVHINDGIGVFLIQRIDAFSIKHFVPPFRSEWVKRSERRAAGSGSPQRRKTVQTKRHPHRHKSLNECLAILFHNWAELYCR